MPRVTIFSRISGVQPIVSRTLLYGLVCWATIRTSLRRVVPRGVDGYRLRRLGLRYYGSRPRSHWRRRGRSRRRGGRRGWDGCADAGARRAYLTEFDRLEECRGDRDTVPPGWGE